eukprot:UN28568
MSIRQGESKRRPTEHVGERSGYRTSSSRENVTEKKNLRVQSQRKNITEIHSRSREMLMVPPPVDNLTSESRTYSRSDHEYNSDDIDEAASKYTKLNKHMSKERFVIPTADNIPTSDDEAGETPEGGHPTRLRPTRAGRKNSKAYPPSHVRQVKSRSRKSSPRRTAKARARYGNTRVKLKNKNFHKVDPTRGSNQHV